MNILKIVILDRDGVINHESPEYIKNHAEWHPIPGSLEAIAELCRRGWEVVIATNQSGIGRGLYDEAALTEIHDKMQKLLKDLGGHVKQVFYCPHHPEDKCACRKPAVGLLKQIADEYQLDFPFKTPIPLIGDSMRDLMAAASGGCIPILVLTGNGLKTLKTLKEASTSSSPAENATIQLLTKILMKKTIVCEDLATAVNTLPIFQPDTPTDTPTDIPKAQPA